jgi:competence CoiA-like predicted nuclease
MAIIVRTVKEIFDCKTSKVIETKDFFNQYSNDYLYDLRMKLQSAYKGRTDAIYVCRYCSEKLQLLGGNKGVNYNKGSYKVLHFAHSKSETECPQKSSDTHFSKSEINIMKYNGQKEGEDHKKIKEFIAKYLRINESNNEGVTEVLIERNWRGNDPSTKVWKRPDVRCSFDDKKIAFEIQLSTTFLSVIEERQHFYKENQGFILWIFKDFVIDDNFRSLTDNDVIFSNNQNAFVLDEEAISKSEETDRLTFKCYFKNFDILEEKIVESWEMKWVTLNELIFDKKEYKVLVLMLLKIKLK